jgi:hypothetical protein
MSSLPSREVMFDYLDTLERSGHTGMFCARPHLMRQFDLPPHVAANILSAWMKKDAKQEARS